MVQQEQEKRSVESCIQPFGGASWVRRRKNKKDLFAQVQPTLSLNLDARKETSMRTKRERERERRLAQSKHCAPLVAASAIASSDL
jgi:hypothetical protein